MRPNVGSSGTQETLVRRSTRQAGEEPAPTPPPPPPPVREPTLTQLLMMMDERHNQTMTQIIREIGNHVQNQNGPRPQQSHLNDFQRTVPPKFSTATDPLDAEDWIRTMDKKLEIARVQEQDKVAYATHYLEGPPAFGGIT